MCSTPHCRGKKKKRSMKLQSPYTLVPSNRWPRIFRSSWFFAHPVPLKGCHIHPPWYCDWLPFHRALNPEYAKLKFLATSYRDWNTQTHTSLIFCTQGLHSVPTGAWLGWDTHVADCNWAWKCATWIWQLLSFIFIFIELLNFFSLVR